MAVKVRFKTLLETATDAIHILDAMGNLVLWSPSFIQMLGYTSEEAAQLNVANWDVKIPESEQIKLVSDLVRKPKVFETQHRRKDGLVIDVEVSARGLEVDGTMYLYASARDITKRKLSDKFRNDVERIIRHDIKAPLYSLQSIASIVFNDGMDNEIRALIPGMLKSIRLVTNLLDSSDKILSMEHGRYTPHMQLLDMRKVVKNVNLSLNNLREVKHARFVQVDMLDSNAQQQELVIHGEEFLIEDMLTNLLKNAVEASPDGGEVTVTYRAEQNELRIDIHNKGAIPESIRDLFFEKYATAGKLHGTGLGTYSANLIAKVHGGRIEFTTSEAEGTTVTVILPLPSSKEANVR